MTLFQEWKVKAWQTFWAWPSPAQCKAVVLHGVAGGTLGIGAALGIQALVPTVDSLTFALGFLALAGGLGAYSLYDWWARWRSHQIARANGDLFVLAQNLTTIVREPLPLDKFTEGVQHVLETRCDPTERNHKLEYLLACAVTLNIGAGPWRWPDLLAERVFDNLFPLEVDPLASWPELRARLLETQVEDFYRQEFIQILDALLPGVRRRHQEFLERRAARCAVYKWDLMAAAWHPRRVETWINQDRWDLLSDE